jgi:hypothetical protein
MVAGRGLDDIQCIGQVIDSGTAAAATAARAERRAQRSSTSRNSTHTRRTRDVGGGCIGFC